jgi:hypothetical protein
MATIKDRISSILRDPSKLLSAVNTPGIDENGHSRGDTKNIHLNQPNDVAMNAAGLFAVIEAIGFYADCSGDTSDSGYISALRFFCGIPSGPVTDRNERLLFNAAKRFAHATWLASQIYRGMIETPDKPYARLARTKNDGTFVVMDFDQLPPDEIAKDWEQIKKYAHWLANELGVDLTSTT